MKRNESLDFTPNTYFWRTYTKKAVDYVEEYDGDIHGYEFKWGEVSKVGCPRGFCDDYGASFEKVSRHNYWKFLVR